MCTFGRWFDDLHRNSGGGDEHTNVTACHYRWIRSFDPSVHPIEYIIHKFREKLDGMSIRVFNMHQEGDLFTNFVVSPLFETASMTLLCAHLTTRASAKSCRVQRISVGHSWQGEEGRSDGP